MMAACAKGRGAFAVIDEKDDGMGKLGALISTVVLGMLMAGAVAARWAQPATGQTVTLVGAGT